LYYRYVVDLHTGVMAARSEKFQREQAEARDLRVAAREAQTNLF
jgi:hypothetical protein